MRPFSSRGQPATAIDWQGAFIRDNQGNFCKEEQREFETIR